MDLRHTIVVFRHLTEQLSGLACKFIISEVNHFERMIIHKSPCQLDAAFISDIVTLQVQVFNSNRIITEGVCEPIGAKVGKSVTGEAHSFQSLTESEATADLSGSIVSQLTVVEADADHLFIKEE